MRIENYLIRAGLFGIMAITGIAQACGYDNEYEKRDSCNGRLWCAWLPILT